MGLVDVNQVLAAKCLDFDLSTHPQETFLNRGFQDQIRAAVRLKDFRHRALRTILWLP
jgi:hypothetical protein